MSKLINLMKIKNDAKFKYIYIYINEYKCNLVLVNK